MILSGSEYPKGPYIGFPSYAQPMIGECPVIWLNSPFELIENVFSNVFAISWEYPKTLNFRESTFSVNWLSPNLLALFKVKLLTLAENLPPLPLGNALTSVVFES